jgi:hypothetical protein
MSQTLETPPVEERTEPWRGRPAPPSEVGDYMPFGNVEARNGLQALLEIPLMIRALKLPRGAQVLEIGCGRGVALPVLDDRLEPVELIGLDIDGALLAEARERVRNTCVRADSSCTRHARRSASPTRFAPSGERCHGGRCRRSCPTGVQCCGRRGERSTGRTSPQSIHRIVEAQVTGRK